MKSKEQKVAEADERNSKWSSFSLASKLAALSKRPGKCAKQIKKLTRGGR